MHICPICKTRQTHTHTYTSIHEIRDIVQQLAWCSKGHSARDGRAKRTHVCIKSSGASAQRDVEAAQKPSSSRRTANLSQSSEIHLKQIYSNRWWVNRMRDVAVVVVVVVYSPLCDVLEVQRCAERGRDPNVELQTFELTLVLCVCVCVAAFFFIIFLYTLCTATLMWRLWPKVVAKGKGDLFFYSALCFQTNDNEA